MAKISTQTSKDILNEEDLLLLEEASGRLTDAK